MNTTHLFKKKSKKPVLSSANGSWGERLGEDAYTGWVVILSLSFIVAVVLAGFAVHLFFLINSGRVTAPVASDGSGTHAAFDPTVLDNVTASFDARSTALSSLAKGYVGPSDPSQ